MAGIVLDERLSAIADMVGRVKEVADIGADHGRLGVYLLQNDLASRVQFLDVSRESLEKARRLVEKLGLTERALFSVGDGALAMICEADAVIIAGMGGQLIADIIDAGISRVRNAKLILQPNVAAPELRMRLSHAGFRITDERIVRASGRLYVVMEARFGEERLNSRQLLVGPRLLERGDPLLNPYALKRLSISKRALKGANQGDAPWREELEYECRVWEEIAHGSERSTDL